MRLKKVEISIGLIKLKSSLVCLKRTSQPYKNFIEFPGGKKKNNETATQSLIREIKDCLLYTSDAPHEEDRVDLGGRPIIKKK